MAAILAIIIDYLQVKKRKVAWVGNYGADLFDYYMKLTYNCKTKTHISNFQKIQHDRR